MSNFSQLIFNSQESLIRRGREKNLGVVRRHTRNGNRPTVIFQGKDSEGEDIITINWQDGAYCILPECDHVWAMLLTIMAFDSCPVASGDHVRWYLTQHALRNDDHNWAITEAASQAYGALPYVETRCPGCQERLTPSEAASYLGVCVACKAEYEADTSEDSGNDWQWQEFHDDQPEWV